MWFDVSLLETKSTTFDIKYEEIKGKDDVKALCQSNGTLNIVKSILSCNGQGELNATIEGCCYESCAVVVWDSKKEDADIERNPVPS